MPVALVCYNEAFLCSKIMRFFANRAPILFLSVSVRPFSDVMTAECRVLNFADEPGSAHLRDRVTNTRFSFADSAHCELSGNDYTKTLTD